MRKTVICSICKKSFIPTGNKQIHCPSCKIIASRQTKQKWYKKNNPDAYIPKIQSYCTCGEKAVTKFNGIPYCNKHYLRMKTHGTLNLIVRKSKNTYEIKNSYVELKTSKNEIILIDLVDLEIVLTHSWCIGNTGYPVSNINHKIIKLQRYLLNFPDAIIDHINRNKLDNRRLNLRLCNNLENTKNLSLKINNSSGYSGIRMTKHNTYNVRITVNFKEIHIGNFKTLDEAILKRKEAELKYYGEFAPSLS